MKKLARVFCCLFLLAPGAASAQTSDETSGGDADAVSPLSSHDAETRLLESDWERNFGDFSLTGPDFKRLRRYRDTKRTELSLLQSHLDQTESLLSTAQRELAEQEIVKRSLQSLIKVDQSDTDSIFISDILSIEHDAVLGASTPGKATIGGVRTLMAHLDTAIGGYKKKVADAENAVALVTSNITTFRDDLTRSEDAIDAALRSENRDMLFKAAITAFFSLLIGVMIYRFFQAIHDGAGPKVGGLLLSDGGLQFVTIFVLIIAIILFGILNILEGRELAAILSGIAGYILGRGAQIKSAASPTEDQPPTAPLPAVQPGIEGTTGERSLVIRTADAIIPGRSAAAPQTAASAAEGNQPDAPAANPPAAGVARGDQQSE